MNAAPSLRVGELAQRCAQETLKFRAQLASDASFCLELWRRALQDQLAEAWACVMECFSGSVRAWLFQHPRGYLVVRWRDEHDLVNEAFTRVFEANAKKPLALTSLPALLTYLHRCLHTAILMECRSPHHQTDALDAARELPAASVEETVIGALDAEALWRELASCAADERERRLIELRWLAGYTPAQIAAAFPGDFPTASEVYRLLANVLLRYRRRQRRLTTS